MQINGVDARTAFGMLLQFYNLAKSSDIRTVRACDLRMTEQDGRECIEVCYRSSKNDQMHQGIVVTFIADIKHKQFKYMQCKTSFFAK